MAKKTRYHVGKSGNPEICNPEKTGVCGLPNAENEIHGDSAEDVYRKLAERYNAERTQSGLKKETTAATPVKETKESAAKIAADSRVKTAQTELSKAKQKVRAVEETIKNATQRLEQSIAAEAALREQNPVSNELEEDFFADGTDLDDPDYDPNAENDNFYVDPNDYGPYDDMTAAMLDNAAEEQAAWQEQVHDSKADLLQAEKALTVAENEWQAAKKEQRALTNKAMPPSKRKLSLKEARLQRDTLSAEVRDWEKQRKDLHDSKNAAQTWISEATLDISTLERLKKESNNKSAIAEYDKTIAKYEQKKAHWEQVQIEVEGKLADVKDGLKVTNSALRKVRATVKEAEEKQRVTDQGRDIASSYSSSCGSISRPSC